MKGVGSATAWPAPPNQRLPLAEIAPHAYRHNYRKANCCSKLFYNYIWVLISDIRANGNVMKPEMIEDLSLRDGETDALVQKFLDHY